MIVVKVNKCFNKCLMFGQLLEDWSIMVRLPRLATIYECTSVPFGCDMRDEYNLLKPFKNDKILLSGFRKRGSGYVLRNYILITILCS